MEEKKEVKIPIDGDGIVDTEEEAMKSVGIVDILMAHWISRKLFVVLLGTVFYSLKMLSQEYWMGLVGIYLGVEASITIAGILKGKTE